MELTVAEHVRVLPTSSAHAGVHVWEPPRAQINLSTSMRRSSAHMLVCTLATKLHYQVVPAAACALAVFVAGSRRRLSRPPCQRRVAAVALSARHHSGEDSSTRDICRTNPAGHAEPLTEGLAFLALRQLRGGTKCQAFPRRALRQHLEVEVVDVLHAEVQAAGSTVGVAKLYPSEQDLAALGFLRRVWSCLSVCGFSHGATSLEHAACLLGDVLASIPSEEARARLARALKTRVRLAAAPEEALGTSPGSAVLKELVDCVGTLRKARGRKHAGRRQQVAQYIIEVLSKVGSEVPGRTIAKFVAAVAVQEPSVLLHGSGKNYRSCLKRLQPSHVKGARLWKALSHGSPRLRLLLLDHLGKHGGAKAWERAGVEMAVFLKTCSVGGHTQSDDDAALAKAQLAVLCDAVAKEPRRSKALGLSPKQSMLLAKTQSLGSAASHILHPLLQDMQEFCDKYDDGDYITVAKALAAERPDKACFERLAQAYVKRMLVRIARQGNCLDGLPSFWERTPAALKEPVMLQIRSQALLQYLPNERLVQLLQKWASQSAPKDSRGMLSGDFLTAVLEAIDNNLPHVEAHSLILASRTLEEQSTKCLKGDLISWWERWLQDTIAMCIDKNYWKPCFDVLEGVQGWQADTSSATSAGLAHEAFTLVVNSLCEAAEELPLDLILEVTQVVEHKERKRLIKILETTFGSHLRGERGTLPLVTAIMIANGETPLTVDEGSTRWQASVMSIASQVMDGKVDLFCRCCPSEALYRAVLQELPDGWQRLELTFHSPQTTLQKPIQR